MPHDFPPPPLTADDVAQEAIALERLCQSLGGEALPAAGTGGPFKPPRAGLR